MAENAENFEEYKKKLCEFMNSETTIVLCWEREYSKGFKGWLRSEVTAVVRQCCWNFVRCQHILIRKQSAMPSRSGRTRESRDL
jgi:hypothetical protein